MSIRLNKALRELNIGLHTAVEFLEKRNELGEVKNELSFKLSEAQYQALIEAFKQDAEVRSQAERLFSKKPKDKKPSREAKDNRAESLLKSTKQQQFKPLGKIDLDNVGKKPAADIPVESAQERAPKKESSAKSAASEASEKTAPSTIEPTVVQEKQDAKAVVSTEKETNVQPVDNEVVVKSDEPVAQLTVNRDATNGKSQHEKPLNAVQLTVKCTAFNG